LYISTRQRDASANIIALIIASNRSHTTTEKAARRPVYDWASSSSPRADKRAQMRTASSPNWGTNASVAHDLPRSEAHWTRCAKLSSTARWKSAYTPPARRPLAQRLPESPPTSLPAYTPKPAKRMPKNVRQHLLPQQLHAPRWPPRSLTQRGHHQRNDVVPRLADFCSPSSPSMRHRVRRR
jgi:hypothetical protein